MLHCMLLQRRQPTRKAQCAKAADICFLYVAVAIRQEIEDETKRYLQQNGKVVSADPIQLTVSSPLVPNLTLVDMPGLCQPPWCNCSPVIWACKIIDVW